MAHSYAAEFAEFWNRFPRKTGKIAAQKAYERARKGGATQLAILMGVERYKRTKPDYADWCHPRTWLSQGRWLDEDDAPPKEQRATKPIPLPDCDVCENTRWAAIVKDGVRRVVRCECWRRVYDSRVSA